MAKAPPYARWINAMALARKESSDTEFEGCEEVLAFISIKDEDNDTVKVTDLVQSLMFGTGPTVYRKLSVLSERGFIKVATNKTDGRAKRLTLTKAGEDLLKERNKQMLSFFKS